MGRKKRKDGRNRTVVSLRKLIVALILIPWRIIVDGARSAINSPLETLNALKTIAWECSEVQTRRFIGHFDQFLAQLATDLRVKTSQDIPARVLQRRKVVIRQTEWVVAVAVTRSRDSARFAWISREKLHLCLGSGNWDGSRRGPGNFVFPRFSGLQSEGGSFPCALRFLLRYERKESERWRLCVKIAPRYSKVVSDNVKCYVNM